MSYRPSQPVSRAVPYVGSGWVVGGSEPGSFRQAMRERNELRAKHEYCDRAEPIPNDEKVQLGKPFFARYHGCCRVCGGLIKPTQKIAHITSETSAQGYAHYKCGVKRLKRNSLIDPMKERRSRLPVVDTGRKTGSLDGCL
jgi:hypothetical protein